MAEPACEETLIQFRTSHSSEVSEVANIPTIQPSLSEAARVRLLSVRAEPLFVADWDRVLMIQPDFQRCRSGTLTEWLMERYTAFTHARRTAKFFRVWHDPWRQIAAEVTVTDASLLELTWPFFRNARFVGANFSPGVRDVWMGRPHRLQPGAR